MWLNAQNCQSCPAGSKGKCFLTGTATELGSRFVYHGVGNVRYQSAGGTGDFSLFTDDSNPRVPSSYIIYKRSGGAPGEMAHRMTLQRLTPDLLHGDGDPNDTSHVANNNSAGIFGAPFVEAPEMFVRRGVYYALFGACCAFCEVGTGIGVYAAPSPLGPWLAQGNIGCNATTAQLGGDQCGCGMPMPSTYAVAGQCGAARAVSGARSVTYAQQNSVIVVRRTAGALLAAEPTFIWTGDRWQSACTATVAAQGLPATDTELHCVKAWDLQYWAPLKWDESVVPPLPMQLVWLQNWTVL